jgi:hypothetical protein
MNTASSGGWTLTKITELVLDKTLDRVGLFDVTCGKCNTTKSAIVIPEGKTVLIKCASCKHSGQVHVASLAGLATKSVHGNAHYVGNTSGLPPKGSDGCVMEQEITSLQKKVARLEKRIDSQKSKP